MAKSHDSIKKRKKELARKEKKDQKRQRKLDKKALARISHEEHQTECQKQYDMNILYINLSQVGNYRLL
jgi:hypothetical protein